MRVIIESNSSSVGVWTASTLQMHSDVNIICDEQACMNLRVGTYKYFKENER
jgi:glucosamine-6-phosphate deaminase